MPANLEAEASKNRVLEGVAGMLSRAFLELSLSSGNEDTIAIGGFPSAIIAPVPRRTEETLPKTTNESPIRFEGRTLVVEDPNEGDDGTWTYDVMGAPFEDGVARKANVRNVGAGGLLVWQYSAAINFGPAVGPDVLFNSAVQLLHLDVDALTGSTYPTAIAGNYTNTADAAEGIDPGTLYQLCAHYTRAGKVTIYRRFPGDTSSGGLASTTHYNFTG